MPDLAHRCDVARRDTNKSDESARRYAVRMHLEFEGEVFRWSARREDIYLAEVPHDISAMIRQIPRPMRGFGSVRVAVAVGGSEWRTSLFPDAARGVYVLPLKKTVRDAEAIAAGDSIVARIDVLDA